MHMDVANNNGPSKRKRLVKSVVHSNANIARTKLESCMERIVMLASGIDDMLFTNQIIMLTADS